MQNNNIQIIIEGKILSIRGQLVMRDEDFNIRMDLAIRLS